MSSELGILVMRDDAVIEVSTNVDTILETIVVIDLECDIKIISSVELLTSVSTGAIFDGGSDIDDVDANASSLATAVSALKFVLPAPLEDPLLPCWTPLSCWPMTVLDCVRALQACKPSYHV